MIQHPIRWRLNPQMRKKTCRAAPVVSIRVGLPIFLDLNMFLTNMLWNTIFHARGSRDGTALACSSCSRRSGKGGIHE
jgi:hypothetical protein